MSYEEDKQEFIKINTKFYKIVTPFINQFMLSKERAIFIEKPELEVEDD